MKEINEKIDLKTSSSKTLNSNYLSLNKSIESNTSNKEEEEYFKIEIEIKESKYYILLNKLKDFSQSMRYFIIKVSLYKYFFIYDFKPNFLFILIYSFLNVLILIIFLSIYFWQKNIKFILFHILIPISYFISIIIYIYSLVILGKILTKTESHIFLSAVAQTIFYYPFCIFLTLVFYDNEGLLQCILTVLSGNFINRNILFSRGLYTFKTFFLFIIISGLIIMFYIRGFFLYLKIIYLPDYCLLNI